jgi:hypothetical protein
MSSGKYIQLESDCDLVDDRVEIFKINDLGPINVNERCISLIVFSLQILPTFTKQIIGDCSI